MGVFNKDIKGHDSLCSISFEIFSLIFVTFVKIRPYFMNSCDFFFFFFKSQAVYYCFSCCSQTRQPCNRKWVVIPTLFLTYLWSLWEYLTFTITFQPLTWRIFCCLALVIMFVSFSKLTIDDLQLYCHSAIE